MAAPRLLFVTPLDPLRTDSGGVQRTRHWWQALRTLGDVDTLHIDPQAQSRPKENLFALRDRLQSLPWQRHAPDAGLTARAETVLGRPLDHYQLIVGRYALPIGQLALPARVPAVVDLDDFRYRHAGHAWRHPMQLAERSRKWLSHWLARRALGRYARAFVVHADDAALASTIPCALLPNVAPSGEAPPATPPPPGPPRVLFVGALWHRPNRDGIEHFLRAVWPRVRAEIPQASLLLAGAARPALRARWARQPGVEAPGFVPDLDAAYANASVVIVPIQAGGGSNIKLLEALAHGRPCVTSHFAAAGFGGQLRDDAHCLVASDARAFGDRVIAVLSAPGRYAAMARAGQALVAQRYSPAAFERCVTRHLRPLLAG